ncbi:MAG: ankyrin repeat domain-containing protein [Acidobacteria bacterium]|nr:ankyrin repeat domain-containing protein [Acidobacteriota bacterium]
MKRLLIIAAALFVAFALGVAVVSYLRRERPPSTPLARAAQSGDAASVQNLIAQGADVNARDAEGYTPLAYAARSGDTDTIKRLLDAKADPNARDCNSWGWTPVINAMHKYQDDAARLLVERGADVNARAGGCNGRKSEDGLTPLMYAAKFDESEMVKFLLEHGADPRAEYDGFNALSFAVAGGSLGRLSDIDRAAAHPCPVETVRLLLKAAPDLKLSRSVVDHTVFYITEKKCPEVARLLENRTPAPAPEKRDGDGQTNRTDAPPPVARN